MKSLLSISLLSTVSACSYAPREGIYVENLHFVRGYGTGQRTQLAADLIEYELVDDWDSETTTVPSRINLKTGGVREASQPGRPIKKDDPATESEDGTLGYELSVEGTEYILEGLDGKSISFEVDDYDSSFYGDGYSFFVDEKLDSAYIFYNTEDYSTGTVIVSLNDGSVVSKGILDIPLPHYDLIVTYPLHQVAVLPGMGSMCDSAHYVYYDESSVELRFTEQLDDDTVLTDKDGPLTIYVATTEVDYDGTDFTSTPVAWSIDIVDLTTGATTNTELDGDDIQNMF